MDRKQFDLETSLHRRTYEALREQIKREHAGKYIALAQGRLVAATATFAEAQAAVKHLRPVPEYYLIFPADMEPSFELAYDF